MQLRCAIISGILGAIVLITGIVFSFFPNTFGEYPIMLFVVSVFMFLFFVVYLAMGIEAYTISKYGHKGYCTVVRIIERHERGKYAVHTIYYLVVEYVSDSGVKHTTEVRCLNKEHIYCGKGTKLVCMIYKEACYVENNPITIAGKDIDKI